MSPIKISVVTPSLNQAAFVEETILSVLGQNYENLEYVVVDGGSTDGTAAIIEKYRSRLHYYVSEPDSGHGNALNKGFRRTTGEVMAWINSDDKYTPWAFKAVADIFESFPDVNWITGLQGFWNAQGALVNVAPVFKNVEDFLAGKYEWIEQECVFWRRSLWEKAGGYIDESYRYMVDGELWCRFFALDRLWHANSPLAGYREHETNRGKLFRTDCIAEMNRAIEGLRARVDPAKLEAFERNYLLLHYDTARSIWLRLVLQR
jgi:glycosyltransferase involved in cell wall biosynthesis